MIDNVTVVGTKRIRARLNDGCIRQRSWPASESIPGRVTVRTCINETKAKPTKLGENDHGLLGGGYR